MGLQRKCRGANWSVKVLNSVRSMAVQFVSSFTDNNLSGDQLSKAYLRLNRSQAAQDDGGLQPSLADAADGAAFDEVHRTRAH